MTSIEIKELGINASQSYYNYLEQEGLGRVMVEVSAKELVSSEDRIYKLRLSKKLSDLDAIVLTDLKSKKQYDTSKIKIIEYDIDNNFLIIQVPKDSGFSIESLHHSEILIISDLKFLVQRVLDWYRKNGELISLPSKRENIDTVVDFFHENIQPNSEQKEAVENILLSPFSYVWGAPGTGKTKAVLAYSITKYIEQGQKVAIFAPTNNAIEQVLRGIIEMTEKRCIDLTQIIRLGTPTKAFAEKYGEVCEEKGIIKEINKIDKQIAIIKKVLETENLEKEYERVKNVILQFEELDNEVISKEQLRENIEKNKQELNLVRSKLKNESDRFQRDFDTLSLNYSKTKQEIDKLIFEKQRLEVDMNSFFHSLKKTFSSSTLTKEERRLSDILPIISSKQTELSVQNNKIEIKRQEQQREINLIRNEIQNSEDFQIFLNGKLNDNTVISTILNFIKNEVSFNVDASKLTFDLDLNNRIEKKNKFVAICQKLRSELSVSQAIAEEYAHLSYKKLHEILRGFEKDRENLKSRTTEERLKGVSIIACTLDCYIGRFIDEELPVSHFFLDEAGYACAIKALTMFRSGKPVTFLGDHCQLPPVCVLSNDLIERNKEYNDVFMWAQSAIYVGDIFTKSKNEVLWDYLYPSTDNIIFNQIMKKSSLISTHRFSQNLAQVLKDYVYNEGFKSAQNEHTTRIRFIHVPKVFPLPPLKRRNYGEAKAIEEYLIKEKKLNATDLIILTPYKYQIDEIGKLLPASFRHDHKILTVHGSQGREWETVILSVVDTSDMWFTNSKNQASKGRNLINTAVSRARKELIIVCDYNFWIAAHGQFIQGLLNVAERI